MIPLKTSSSKFLNQCKRKVTLSTRTSYFGGKQNYDLGNGILRFSRSRMYTEKTPYMSVDMKPVTKIRSRKSYLVEKPLGGEKNSDKSIVFLKKPRNFYLSSKEIKKHISNHCIEDHGESNRSSLVRGTVCTLLTGRHKGKRVVLLKRLKSGLLLVTGPFLLNACPLLRISQRFVVATTTKIDLSKLRVPAHIHDYYFSRQRKKQWMKSKNDVLIRRKEVYHFNEKRKADQKYVDKQVLKAIIEHPDKKLLFTYLSTLFRLKSSQ